MSKKEQIISIITQKGVLKQKIFDNTLEIFNTLKKLLSELETEYNEDLKNSDSRIRLSYKNAGLFQCELKVAGDILIFNMHTNVFEFDREHKIWSIPIAAKDKNSTYSGIISIYNFLSDSLKYNRTQDLGYMIARIFINKEKHYFVEGKQQMGYLSNNFGTEKLDKEKLRGIVESAILYSQKFDLLVPPYNNVSVIELQQILDSRQRGLQTGKRMGFAFRADDISGEDLLYTGA